MSIKKRSTLETLWSQEGAIVLYLSDTHTHTGAIVLYLSDTHTPHEQILSKTTHTHTHTHTSKF